MAPSGNGDLLPDWNTLPFHSTKGLILGTSMVASAAAPGAPRLARRVLLIGLGGGVLAGWLLQHSAGLEALDVCEVSDSARPAARAAPAVRADEGARDPRSAGLSVERAQVATRISVRARTRKHARKHARTHVHARAHVYSLGCVSPALPTRKMREPPPLAA